MTDPASVGWAARLVSKLPTLRGIANWFYVSANWGRISEDFEQYRRQIKDREEWAKQAATQQAELHELGMQRALLGQEVELDKWRRLAEQITKQRDSIAALAERAVAVAKQITEERTSAWVDCMVLLAQLLERESPLTRAQLLNDLDEQSRRVVEILIERSHVLKRGESRPGVTWPPGLGSP